MNSRQKKPSHRFSAYQEEFLLEYFKEMRHEINLRITNHNNLVWAKVITTGALMGFLITQNVSANVRLYGFSLVPVIAILYDVMVAQNIRAIHHIGIFIRDNIENVVFPDFVLWEKYGGQKDKRERNYGSVDILLLSLFTLGTMAASVFLLWNEGRTQVAMVVATASILIYVVLLRFMSRYILYFKK